MQYVHVLLLVQKRQAVPEASNLVYEK